jgi:hypothetical protein
MATNNATNMSNPVTVPQGGTGDASFTAYSVLTGGTTSTSALQNVSGLGTSGQVLVSTGTSSLPTWQTASVLTIQTAQLTLTSAQVKLLHATPIELIAAPGAGKVISILNVAAKFNYGGTNVFVAGASQTIDIFRGSTITYGGLIVNAMITSNANKYAYLGPDSNPLGAATLFDNINVNVRNTSATEISGNAANNNTFTIQASYYIVTL